MQHTKGCAGQGDDLAVFYLDDDQDDLDTFKDIVEEIRSDISISMHNSSDRLFTALNNPPPNPSVLFLDLNMPGRDGFEVLQEIRRSDDYSRLPIVILSTSSDEHTINKCRDMGANYYIPKANDYTILKRSIGHALQLDWATFKAGDASFLHQS